MSTKTTSSTTNRDADTFLRGVAISCVVLIHFLSSFKESPYINESSWQTLAVTLDQLSRVAVPLFVALSGYGLMQRYQDSQFEWKEFLKKRVFKLVPLYILWSYIYWFIFWFIPQWRPTAETKPFFGQLLLGNADYHLYFVPMVFQLYLLFPFLLKVVKKFPYFSLLIAGIFQILFYVVISNNIADQPGSSFFQSDQKQYIWFFSWIFYFVLGMCLPKVTTWIYVENIRVKLLNIGLLITAMLVSVSAITTINGGVDPLVALRFTRLEVFLYASVGIVALFLVSTKQQKFSRWSLILGEHSYLLYLSHTLLLRILFLFINQGL